MYRFTNDLFKQFPEELKNEILIHSTEVSFKSGTEILKQGEYIKVIPLVLDGLIKVVLPFEEKDFLLYYIQKNETCVMSFTASLNGEKSKIQAIAEQDTTALALPIEMVSKWVHKFPEINFLLFEEYNKRYSELIDTIQQILFQKMDCRIMSYLKERSSILGMNPMRISHREIASDLGTAREVVSRIIKKLENEGHLKQENNTVEILQLPVT